MTIDYKDFNGLDRTEDFYFNLNEAELAEMELSKDGALTAMLQTLIAAQDMPAVFAIFKKLLLTAYGKKSVDGRNFIKSEAISTEFECHAAYPTIFMKLTNDADAAVEFVKGIIPSVHVNSDAPAVTPVS